jgi:hypothetical protein
VETVPGAARLGDGVGAFFPEEKPLRGGVDAPLLYVIGRRCPDAGPEPADEIIFAQAAPGRKMRNCIQIRPFSP